MSLWMPKFELLQLHMEIDVAIESCKRNPHGGHADTKHAAPIVNEQLYQDDADSAHQDIDEDVEASEHAPATLVGFRQLDVVIEQQLLGFRWVLQVSHLGRF
ncbi:hypothetical protein ZWY2020_043652 [Hordeum vulgare]|nr:hypothetical protein ZWY2020_043652 [Hordeum vulgare]